MSAKNIYHRQVRNALRKDGWTITHDPLSLKAGGRDLYIDLGAEQLFAAEKAERKIAVEIQSFLGPSDIFDLQKALGQFAMYHEVLEEQQPDRVLYLAVPEHVQQGILDEPIGRLLLKKQRLRVIVFEPQEEVILQWIP